MPGKNLYACTLICKSFHTTFFFSLRSSVIRNITPLMQNISITNIPTANNAVKTIIEGDLVITESEELKQALLDLLNSYQSVDIQFKNIGKLDISALQLLVAGIEEGKG